jgi:hypothetical protein
MKAIRLIALAFLFLMDFSATSGAHEFWLEPESFLPAKGGAVRLAIRVGENFAGKPWEPGASRATRFESIYGGARTNLLPLIDRQGLDRLAVDIAGEGTHLLVLTTNSKFIELEPAKFEHYLGEDGLDHVRDWRAAHGQSDRPGRELYRREAATLIQLGERANDVALGETGFDLNILPEKNPYALHAGDVLPLRVLFRGAPLTNALVVHWARRADGGVDIARARSDSQGRVAFTLATGDVMLSVVHMIESEDRAAADWQSIWGNLTFHVR